MVGNSRQASKAIKSSHPSKAFLALDQIRKEGWFTDVTLMTEGRRFPAHKAVLSACSPYFNRMFWPGFVEQENQEVMPLKYILCGSAEVRSLLLRKP